MSSKRYPEEFRIEAVKQMMERGYPVAKVLTGSECQFIVRMPWSKAYGVSTETRQEKQSQSAEIRRLKAELKRVTEERAHRNVGRFHF
ncbi:transposase [Azospira sp. I09]|uniref:transposase n=1 Tax=Azospira sp. I09 TaxID=1765049 RepID=UPI0012613AF7|nr:transposase [Azospira sp. I09]BBN88760.1 hypothetical protein AZSP09_17830 [Azospira sp. I09]